VGFEGGSAVGLGIIATEQVCYNKLILRHDYCAG